MVSTLVDFVPEHYALRHCTTHYIIVCALRMVDMRSAHVACIVHCVHASRVLYRIRIISHIVHSLDVPKIAKPCTYAGLEPCL